MKVIVAASLVLRKIVWFHCDPGLAQDDYEVSTLSSTDLCVSLV
jgi:hypothetical protein